FTMPQKNNLRVFPEIKRVVILGDSGFIGTHLYGHFKKVYPGLELLGFSFPKLDLAKKEDALSLAQVFDAQTLVIMCSGIKKQWGDNLDNFSQNLSMAENICTLLEKNPVRRFVYFSSAEVYGEDTENSQISENTPVNPTSFYGIAKFASERLLKKTIQPGGETSLLILRPSTVYGPGDSSKGYGPVGFLESILQKKEVSLWGDGQELREFVFVHDLVKAVAALAFCDYAGVVNIASGKSRKFKEILEIILKVVPLSFQTNSRPRTKHKVDQVFSNDLLRKLLPGFSFTTLEKGIEQIYLEEYKQLTQVKV
ncbi:MAG: NAD(P)-dependent oxidoreductase, partial [Candidatus Omnitrophica bacterium]|nr:NAD(P)-dependent oxidoreductase [Candidatus Omnitrophota bacterium]